MQLENTSDTPTLRAMKRKVDGRTWAARRHKELIREIAVIAGDQLSALDQAAINNLAGVQLRVEQLTAAAIRGEPVDNGEFIRMTGLANRLFAGLRRRAPTKPAMPDPRSYLLQQRERRGSP